MKSMIFIVILVLYLKYELSNTADTPYSERMAETVLALWKNASVTPTWTYEQGVVLKGLDQVWRKTSNQKYLTYIQQSLDLFIQKNGTINTYPMEEYNLDNIKPGSITLTMFNITADQKYKIAAQTLREQLRTHPRTKEGGFWHKKKYPYQMWLDGLYMAEPFYAEWALTFNETDIFDDVVNQFVWMETHARDANTSLLYHGWDESRAQVWSKETGHSSIFWARAMGWYGMALVDVLDYIPLNYKRRNEIIDILKRYVVGVRAVQDSKSAVWWDVLNAAERDGNYLESSASCMFVYTFAKGVKAGHLPSDPYLGLARRGYDGIVKQFIETNSNDNHLVLNSTVRVSSLDSDGTYDYYVKQQIVKNDPKGIGPFLLVSALIESIA